MEEQNKKLKFADKMEGMQGQELEKRVEYGRNYKIPHQITLIPSKNKSEQIVEHIFPELIALCPVTGIRDLYKFVMRYIPDKHFPEMKSFKFYLMDYIQVPISHETLADKLYNEIKEAIKPKKLYIELQTAERGEITTTPRVGDMKLSKYEEKPFRRA